MTESVTLTEEDRAWLDSPVDVQVDDDNRLWLDELLKMKQAELINYGTLQYGIPDDAAKASNRNDLISLIVMANKAGGGQAVSKTKYRYLKDLIGIVPPQITHRKSGPLYLTRGQGRALQVWHKGEKDWKSYEDIRPKVAENAAQVADKALEGTATGAAADSDPGVTQIPLSVIVPALPGMKVPEIKVVAKQLGIENVDNEEAFPNKDALITAIKLHLPEEEQETEAENGEQDNPQS